MFKNRKIYKIILSVFLIIFGLLSVSYLIILPALFSNQKIINFIQKELKNSANIDCVIKKPVLKTKLTPNLDFSIQNLSVKKEDKQLISIQNFQSEFGLSQIFKKKIIIKKIGADYIFANINELQKLTPQKQEEKKEKIKIKLDLFHSLLYVKNALIIYNPKDNLTVKLSAKNIKITETRNPKYVQFDISAEINKNNEKLILNLKDENKVFFDKRTLFINGCEFLINNTKVTVNFQCTQDNKFELNLISDDCHIEDLVKLLSSNLIVSNGEDFFTELNDLNGKFKFKITVDNFGSKGQVDIKTINFKIKSLNNLPILLNKGAIKIDRDKISLSNIEGYHGSNKENSIHSLGSIDNYMTDLSADIDTYIYADKEFTNKYLSKTVGIPIELVGKTFGKINFKMKDNIMNIMLLFGLKKGSDLLIDKTSFSPVNYERACKADIEIVNNNLELKNLNYYISEKFKRGEKAPELVKLYGNFDMLKNMAIKNFGFEIPKPLPSEFFNVIIGQQLFKRGTISGNMEYINLAQIPYLKGDVTMEGVRIPSQRLGIKKGILSTDNKKINITANGRFKRAQYNFDGEILNEMKLPVIVKSINLKLDNVDVERMMQSLNSQTQNYNEQQKTTVITNDEAQMEKDDNFAFDTHLVVIENCLLEVIKGVYKEIKFNNLKANLTLDKNGLMDIKSNRFDIAEGISSTHIVLDLKNQLYNMKLGVKDVESNIIATALLNLPREISGKARGFINIETDKTLKLNGSMKFDIKNGTIAKIGLVQYTLNFVSLFRNPLAMISPATFGDLVNMPEGIFDKISGKLELKNNTIERIMIKSEAPQLSTFIVGRYDLEKSDATLRIYTKFSNKRKGFSGFLRKISLNALANRVPMNSRNDSNYYASEIAQLPPIDADEKDCQIFLTKVDGDVEHNNFLSSLKRIK